MMLKMSKKVSQFVYTSALLRLDKYTSFNTEARALNSPLYPPQVTMQKFPRLQCLLVPENLLTLQGANDTGGGFGTYIDKPAGNTQHMNNPTGKDILLPHFLCN